MVIMIRERTAKSQIGFCSSAGAAYTQGDGDINFANGQYILFRMPLTVPKGSTINSAIIRFNHNAKNDQAQTCYNSLRAHASGDSPMLIVGANESARPWTAARVEQTLSWTVGLPANEMYSYVNVKPILDELLARSDFRTGGYVTFMYYTDNENGSDMGVRANNDFVPTPRLTVDYTPPNTDLRVDINMFENSEFSTEVQAVGTDGNTVPYWGQNPYYGAYVDSANFGTMTRDASFVRLSGIPTLRFTCGTPPAETNKRTGPMSGVLVDGGRKVIFCGWVYVPSTIPVAADRLFVGDPYLSGQGKYVTARDTWVPFCTEPMSRGVVGELHVFYPAVGLKEFQSGWQFWLSEPTIMYSDFRQMPFNGLTPDLKDSGGVTVIDMSSSATKQQSTKVWTPRTGVIRGGVLKRVPRYSKRSDGILQNAEPIKGGLQIQQMPAIAMSSYPEGKTISEL